MLTTGQKIIRARVLLGAWADPPRDFSQTELAAALGVTQGSVGHWESDRRRPDADSYRDLARVLGVRLDWLLGGKEPMYESGELRPAVQPPATPTAAREVEIPELDKAAADKIQRRLSQPVRPRDGHGKRRGKSA